MPKEKCENCNYWYQIGYGDASERAGIAENSLDHADSLIKKLSFADLRMTTEGMREWDTQHKAGVRDWPNMLIAVYNTMAAAVIKDHETDGCITAQLPPLSKGCLAYLGEVVKRDRDELDSAYQEDDPYHHLLNIECADEVLKALNKTIER